MSAGFLSPLVRRESKALRLVRADGLVLADRIEVAFDSRSRRHGLLGRDGLEPGGALIIAPCNAVHTWFMRFAIDLWFTARDGRILKVCEDVAPWRTAGSLKGFAVVELAAGRSRALGMRPDDVVRVEPGDGCR